MKKQTTMDRITNLPWDVLDTIFTHLPIRDAARTSVLSSKWRYKWTGQSEFVFDDRCLSSPTLDTEVRWGVIMKIIRQLQSRPSGGPLEKFKLAALCCPNYSDLDLLIRYLTEQGLKELIIKEFRFFKRYKVPSCLLSCSQLTRLELYGCFFKLPSGFKEFSCLQTLVLTHASIPVDTLERLIRNCPALERLMLINIDRVDLRIHNQNLKYLKIDTEFVDICLENCPRLMTVDIRMTMHNHHLSDAKPCYLVRVLDSLKNVQKLTLSGSFLDFLANGDVPQRLPTTLDNLLSLELLELRFGSLRDMEAAFCIHRSSPTLKNLLITVAYSTEVSQIILDFLREQNLYDFNFVNLRHLKVRGISCTRTESEFIKLMLLHSPVLETMTIVRFGGDRIPESLLMELDRSSENVKFISLTL